jgi:hypothetical protein
MYQDIPATSLNSTVALSATQRASALGAICAALSQQGAEQAWIDGNLVWVEGWFCVHAVALALSGAHELSVIYSDDCDLACRPDEAMFKMLVEPLRAAVAGVLEQTPTGADESSHLQTEPDKDSRAASAADSNSTQSCMLAYAIAYARHGMRVFPCHEIEADSYCSCGATACKSAGKHPRIKDWQILATCDEDEIRKWWQQWPGANIGIACGQSSNLTVLDVDGDTGRETLRALELEHGELPETPIAITGSGGAHYYFAYERGPNNAVRFAPGLDIRTEGGLVVGVGSRNGKGSYAWEAAFTLGSDGLLPAAMPRWLIDIIKTGQGEKASPNGKVMLPAVQSMIEGAGRHNEIWRLGRSLLAQNVPHEAIRAALEKTNAAFKEPMAAEELKKLIQDILTRGHTADFQKERKDQVVKPWREPQPLPGALPEVPALKKSMLPEALRAWLVDVAERAQAPLDFPATAAIVALSSALGRRRGIQPKRKDDWLVVPNLWGFIVSPPGTLKSPMLHEALKPMVRLEAAAREKHKLDAEAYSLEKDALDAERKKVKDKYSRAKSTMSQDELKSQLKELQDEPPVRVRYMVSDPSIEMLGVLLNQNPNGVLLFRDELAGFLATMEREGHENDRAFYLEAWNGNSRYTYDRINRGTLDIDAACVSVLGAITPGPLATYLRETFSGTQDDGLIQRFQLAVYPDPPAKWRNIDHWPDTAAKNEAFALFERFVGFGTFGTTHSAIKNTEIYALRFNDEAQDFFDTWRDKLEKKIRDEDEHPVITAHLAKYRSLMPSLALIFHLCDSSLSDTPVSLKAAELAASWCEYLEPHARRIYYSISSRLDTTARLLGQKIKAKKLAGPFTARDIYRHHWTGLTSPDDVSDALAELEALYWVNSETIGGSSNGGRPSLRYHLNPRIWESSEKTQAHDRSLGSVRTDKTPGTGTSGTSGTDTETTESNKQEW